MDEQGLNIPVNQGIGFILQQSIPFSHLNFSLWTSS